MKEATGELSMTVITIIAVLAILVIINFVVPMVSTYINGTFTNITSYVEIVDSGVNV